MVRRWIVGAALAALASPAQAQPDWRAAGGDIFAAPASAELSATGEAPGPSLPSLRQPFTTEVEVAAAARGLDPKLLHALIVVESAYRTDAVSPAGAGGLTQLMPATARDLGVRDRFDPAENLSGGAAYLARQLLRFQDLRLALAAFNAGPAAVARLGRIPANPETQAYVGLVVDCYLALAAGRTLQSARDCKGRVP